MTPTPHFRSARLDWCTPADFFKRLDALFRFDLDPACTKENALTERCYAHPEQDGLAHPWAEARVWCNPPYGREIKAWVAKAVAEARSAQVIVMLVPARTDTKWWHAALDGGARVVFLRGRLRFAGATAGAPFPSALLIWERALLEIA